ncbi:hypothetical protein HDV06_005161 [Boothiomyces sp. JEL0866]|nr:hypothetical protein HDV06_005161 [Boothiomyces sp. JEL0866]
MTTFMCQTMNMASYAFYLIMAVPYLFRMLWTVVMVYVTMHSPIPGLNLFLLLVCEAISFLHDLLIVKYAELKLARGVDIRFMDLIIECIQPQTFSIIMVFSIGVAVASIGEGFGYGYLSPTGTMIASASYYTYRSVLVELIDNYILQFKSGRGFGEESNSKSEKNLNGKFIIDNRENKANQEKEKQKEKETVTHIPQAASSLFFKHNEALVPPYQVIVDTNFINFSIQNKLEMVKAMMDCLYAKCIPCITDCVMAELEKMGEKYRIALKVARDPRFERLPCSHKGTYADDCIVNRITQHRCYIVATCDRDLKRRIRKIPGVPIMYIASRKYAIERLPESLAAIDERIVTQKGQATDAQKAKTREYFYTQKLMDVDTNGEGVFGSENMNSAALVPVLSEKDIDYSMVYALYTFIASMDGQITVEKGQTLELLDDSNSYWWAVKNAANGEIGYIPAENIETPQEKLARFNKSRNVDNTQAKDQDKSWPKQKQNKTRLAFAEYHTEIYLDGESEVGSSLAEESENFMSSASVIVQKPVDVQKKRPGFLGNFFKAKKKDSKQLSEPRPIAQQSVPSSGGSNDEQQNTPINILRVYAGNISLNATFKSVTFNENSTIEDLTRNTLKRFRVPNAVVQDYYLTIMHVKDMGSERALDPKENINDILNSFNVLSLKPNPNTPDSQLVRAHRAIKIFLNKQIAGESKQPQKVSKKIQIAVDAGNNQKLQWEMIDIGPQTKAGEVLEMAKNIFGSGDGQYDVINLMDSTLPLILENIMDPNVILMPLADIAGKSNQYLPIVFRKLPNLLPGVPISESPKDTLDDLEFNEAKVKDQPPRRQTGIRPSSPDRNPPNATQDVSEIQTRKERAVPPKSGARSTSNAKMDLTMLQESLSSFMGGEFSPTAAEPVKEKDPFNFDLMLDNLDQTISRRLENEPSLDKVLDNLQKSIDAILTSEFEKTTTERRTSRLSILYNLNPNETEVVDVGKLFEDFKKTSSNVAEIDSNLNQLLFRALQKYGVAAQ